MPFKTKHLDLYKEHMRIYFTDYLQAYRDRVNTFYSEVYTENPEAFPFMKPTLVVTIFRNFEIISFLNLSQSANDEIRLFEDFFENDEEYDRVRNLPEHLKEERLLKIAGLDSYLEETKNWYFDYDQPPYYDSSPPKFQGSELADKHYYSFLKKENKKKLDLYDVEAVITKVNNEEFQYELEEAIKAYNSGLYLACTAVVAVSIETLLKILVVSRLGENFLPKPIYYIISLAEVLKDNSIIDERFFLRIKSFNELRRSATHSKSGKLDKWDAEQALSLVKLIVEKFF